MTSMRNAALIDAGPLIALFDGTDRHHARVLSFMRRYRGRLVTTWPVLTEALHLLDFSHGAQDELLQWLERGGLALLDLDVDDIKYMRQRMAKYADLPMDLADASLMCVAERNALTRIISIDSDFSIYRTLKGKYLSNLLS